MNFGWTSLSGLIWLLRDVLTFFVEPMSTLLYTTLTQGLDSTPGESPTAGLRCVPSYDRDRV